MNGTNRAYVSTTSLIRQALEKADGNVAQAVSVLGGWAYDYPNAKSAIAVIKARAKGAARVQIEASGFIAPVAA